MIEERSIFEDIAIEAALTAGEAILKIYNATDRDINIQYKSDQSPLTIADTTSHEIIAEALKKTGLPLLSEEGSKGSFDERKNWETFWLVDPLDGTKEFIKRNGEFTVNIALIQHNTPIGGVVYAPVLDSLYFTYHQKAWRIDGNSAKGLHVEDFVKNATPLPQQIERVYTVVASRSHLNDDTRAFIEKEEREHPDMQCITCGSSLKLCAVAEGKADVYPRFAPTMEWDTAAGEAVARAAKCDVVDSETGLPLRYNKEDLHNPYFIVKRN